MHNLITMMRNNALYVDYTSRQSKQVLVVILLGDPSLPKSTDRFERLRKTSTSVGNFERF